MRFNSFGITIGFSFDVNCEVLGSSSSCSTTTSSLFSIPVVPLLLLLSPCEPTEITIATTAAVIAIIPPATSVMRAAKRPAIDAFTGNPVFVSHVQFVAEGFV